ncbi:DotA/TraY family protein [Neorhizobium sp. T786]|uniref:DotA/TraY family protein n=1 Tax=Pseudorhizobium xiangyangii TaxID=2883104 RepID=UPI001CFF60D5|nr:DotA/TraY family protein [Neorhizobium xiangyangii]MCB5205315.1 DotA/TraY family protein [Neorhizobium xiangyangii]
MGLAVSDLLATPSEHNIAWMWVNVLLPSDTTTGFGLAMSIFSSTLVYIGSLTLLGMIFQGVISTAASGKVLGDKYHQIYAPLRVVIGIGLMIPVSHGFSNGHLFLRDVVARASINLVDAMWVGYVEHVVQKHHALMPMSAGGEKVVLDLLESEICAAVHNKMAEPWGLTPVILPEKEGVLNEFDKLGVNIRAWDYGQDCGRVDVVRINDKPGFSDDREKAVADQVENLRAFAAYFGKLFSVQNHSLSNEQALKNITSGTLPRVANALRRMGDDYDAKISAAVATEMALDKEGVKRRKKIVEAARQQGFVTAGMFWMAISKESAAVNQLVGLKHSRTGVRVDEDGSSNSDNIRAALQTLRHLISGEEAEIGLEANDLAGASDQKKNFITKALAPFARSLAEWMMSRPKFPDETIVDQIKRSDPIAEQVSSGHTFMAIAVTGILATLVPVIAAFTIAGSTLGTDGAALWAMPWLGTIFGTLWMIGAVRAYIIPVLPFIYMVIFAGLWLLAVLEAAIAIIVWAFGWLRMDGEDMLAQASKMGAMLLFSVFLMLPIGMLAFIAAFLLLPLLVGTVDVLWSTMWWGNHEDPGLTSMLVGFILSTFLLMYLIIHIFGQIFVIVDRILTWMGQQGHGFSDKGMLVGTAGAAAAVLGKGMPGMPTIPKSGKKDEGGEEGGVKARSAQKNDTAG